MKGRIVSLAIVVLMILGSVSAVGTQVSNPLSGNEDDIVSAGMLSGGRKALVAGGGVGLNYADDDATDMYNLLTANGWSASDIIVLTNSQVTISTITADLETMAAGTTSDSISLFFFSGHGTSDGTNHAICGYDSSLLYDDEFNDILSGFNGRVVSILDSCYSGGMGPPGQCVDTDEFVTKFIEGATLGRGNENRVILMACAANEYSYETSELQNGVFSYYVLEGLDGPADTAEETYNYAHPRTEQYEPSQHPQLFDGDTNAEVPIVGGGGGGYIEVTKFGNEYSASGGQVVAWPPHGVELSEPGWPNEDIGWTSYVLDIADKSDITSEIQIGVEIKDESASGDGPQLYAYKWSSSSWVEIVESEISDVLTWYWYTIPINDYVTDVGGVGIKVYAESSDDICLDEVGVRYELKPLVPNLDCDGSLSWTKVSPGGTVTGSFTVKNVGDSGSKLNWGIVSYPDWGTWTFNPDGGTGLGSSVTVQVSVKAPNEKEKSFSGTIKVVNSDNSGDYDTVSVSLSTPKSKSHSDMFFVNFLQKFLIFRAFLSNFLLNIR
jgi:hypothetical protein